MIQLIKMALDILDKELQNENNVLTYDLKSGDMMFSNNKWLIHDRTDFIDYDEPDLKRMLIRTWIRE
jgi:alpha-ketoglutarate-dependent taurine dioxygenase